MATAPHKPTARQRLEIEWREYVASDADYCQREFGYYPAYFMRMIEEQGAMAATISLIMANHVQDGFYKLAWELHRPDLTLENAVCNPRFAALFDNCPEVIERARERLRSVGYTPRF
jgi:hypothetical protein